MEDETLTPKQLDALTEDQLLDMHLELARLEIRHANLMPGHLPKLSGVSQQKFEHHVIEPLQNRPERPPFSFEADLARATDEDAEKGVRRDVILHTGGLKDEDEAILERYEEECDTWHKDICLAALENAKEKITQTENLHYYEALKEQIELFFVNMRWEIPKGASTAPEEKQRKSQRVRLQVTQFPVEDGTQWDEINMTFIGIDKLKIEAREKYKTYFHYEIGFSGRKPTESGALWNLLLLFAAEKGTLDRNAQSKLSEKTDIKKLISILRERLRRVIPIDGDPIPFHPGGVFRGGVGGQLGTADAARGRRYGGEYKTRFKINQGLDLEAFGDSPHYAPTGPKKLPDTSQETPDEPLMIPRRSRGIG